MSEVGPAPPSGAEGVSDRPPSKPSRLPLFIWTGIALFCLVMFGTALALFLWSREALSSNDLKKATSVKITYVKGKKSKEVIVNDPAELKSLLDALVITEAQMGPVYGTTNGGSVEFTLPDGKTAQATFATQTQLNRSNWGYVMVEPGFYRKVNEIATRAEGKAIDVLKQDN